MNIKGNCFTNLDAFWGASWPHEFAFPPRVGDYVQAEDKRRLRVVSVMHCMDREGPRVTVELHN